VSRFGNRQKTVQKKKRGGWGRNSSTNSGLYKLVIRLGRRQVIDVGHLGRFAFPSGYYIYTGSAKRGLESRIVRHLRREKRLRWHIDYLLGQARIVEVKRYHGSRYSECELSRRVRALPGSKIVAPGFGSSDCRCSTHLFHFRRNAAWERGPKGKERSRFVGCSFD
jgi:Uri superfamily endonuclease